MVNPPSPEKVVMNKIWYGVPIICTGIKKNKNKKKPKKLITFYTYIINIILLYIKNCFSHLSAE